MESLSSRIAGTTFPIGKKGYEPADVDGFVADTAKAVRTLEEELTVSKAKSAQLEQRLRSTSDADTVVQTAFLAAAEAKAKLLQEAEARGAEIIAEAEAEASYIRNGGGSAARDDSNPEALEGARRKAAEIEATAVRLLEEARAEAETIVADAKQHITEATTGEVHEALEARTDEAREELHRLMWLLKTVKQAIHSGLVAAQAEAPEIELILEDSVELAEIRPRAEGHTIG